MESDVDQPKTEEVYCQCCKKDRERRKEPLRPLVRMPDDIMADSKREEPLYLCEYCDGPALELVTAEYKRASSGD